MNRVLLTTDGSAGSLHASAVGSRILGHDSERILLHVVPPVPSESPSGRFTSGTLEAARVAAREDGEGVLSRAADALDVELTRVLAEGDPAMTICSVAEERDVDVIVVGTRGVGPIKRALLGSVSDQVTRESQRPVLVVPNPD